MLVPWNLDAPHLQEWARKNLPKNAKQSLIEIVDQMKDVDGLTLLDECVWFVESKGNDRGAGNWNRKALEKHVGKIKVRPCTPHMLCPSPIICVECAGCGRAQDTVEYL